MEGATTALRFTVEHDVGASICIKMQAILDVERFSAGAGQASENLQPGAYPFQELVLHVRKRSDCLVLPLLFSADRFEHLLP